MRFSGLLIFILMFMANAAHSACYNNCVTPPSCESMGYKLESEISCPDGAILCPFDTRYKWCKEYKCEDGRYTETQNIGNEKGYKCDQVNYHGNNCFDCYCSPNPNECKWTEKNKGQGNISDPCCDGTFAKCENTCADTVTVPEHAHGNTVECFGCGQTKDIITSWSCDDWYDPQGEGCYARPCDTGSTAWRSAEDCGDTGSAGWSWSTQNHYSGPDLCGICTAKSCLDGFSTERSSVSTCGKSGSAGWDWNKSGQYAGDDVCGKCTAKNCPTDESTISDVTTCGVGGANGWTRDPTANFNGDTQCYKCNAKGCPNGESTDSNATACATTGAAGWNRVPTSNYNGNTQCYKCNAKPCPEFESTDSSVNACTTTGAAGWTRDATKNFNGNAQCYKCTPKDCPKNESTSNDPTVCGAGGANGWTREKTKNFDGNVQCFICQAKNCPEGENTSDDASACGTKGTSGWTKTASGYYNGNTACYKCQEKPCPNGESTDSDVSVCGSGGADGWNRVATTNFNGEKQCYKCEMKTCPVNYEAKNMTVKDCGAGSGWQVLTSGKHGDVNCSQCKCNSNSNCTWGESNKGEGTLSELCCNGKYAVCTNTCGTAVSIPQNASCSDPCVSCLQTEICQAWACNDGFEKTTDGKGCCIRMKEPSENCAVGDVYYSNGKCGKAEDYSSINCQGYIPVGVVYFVDGDYMRVIGLKDLRSNENTWEFEPDKAFTNSRKRVAWGNYYTDIPTLTSYALDVGSIDVTGVYPALRALAFPRLLRARDHELFDGKTNTTLQSQSKSAYEQCLNGTIKKGTTDYPKYCQPSIGLAALSFCPPNVKCDDPRVGKGQWYVPAVGEWMELTGYEFEKFTEVKGSGEALGATKKVYQTVTATLTTLIKNGADAEKFIDQQYWTSNESSEQNGIIYDPDTGLIAMTLKSLLNTRLGLEIGCPKDALDSKPAHADEKFAEASKCTTKSGQTKYKTFECLDGYAKKGNTCVKGCAIGDVYYDDGTCGKVWNYDNTKTKKAVGVVFYVDDNHMSGKVVNFRLLSTDENGTFNPDLPYNGQITDHTMFWGLNNTVLSDITFTQDKLLEALKKKDAWVTDGKKNTSWILEQKATSCHNYQTGTAAYNQYCQASAAKAAREFYPPETTKENAVAGAGHWHFASFREMMLMFGYEPDQVTDATGTSGMTALVYAKLHSTMSALKNGLSVDARTMSPAKYFSSNRWNDQKPWSIDFSSGERLKDWSDGGNMRPVLDFTYKEQK